MYSAAHAGRDLVACAPPDLSDLVAREVMAGSYRTVTNPRETLIDAVETLSRTRLEAEVSELERQIHEAQRRGVSAHDEAMRLLQIRLQLGGSAAYSKPRRKHGD
jgi:hypothetical protein